jgi:S-formylglutathione hydrolase FrmB
MILKKNIFMLLLCTCVITYTDSLLILDSVPIVNSTALPSPGATTNVRFITVYMPAAALDNPNKRFPCVYHLPGLGGDNNSFAVGNQNIMDDLIKEGQVEPFIIVHVDPSLVNGIDTDGKRRYQGTWYVNSALNGGFEDFMVNDLIPYVDAHYPTINNSNFRAVMGQSMGGYGSQYHGITHPELYCAFGHASGTPFFLLTTNSTLVAPAQPSPGFEMFTFNSFILPEIPTSGPNAGKVTPDNGPLSFSIFSYAGAFSPNVNKPPYYVDLPFEVDAQSQPILVDGPFFVYSVINGSQINTGKSLIARPDVIAKWTQFDPYLLLDNHVETTKRQGIYHDGGSAEPLNAAGARLLSEKMASLGIDSEYILFNGGHTTCLTSELCARYRTIFQMISTLFAQQHIFTDDIRIRLAGSGSIILKGNAQCILENVTVGIETIPTLNITQTTIDLVIQDNASLTIGNTQNNMPGILQIGNRFTKAITRANPDLENHIVSGSITIDGPNAALIIGNNSVLGIGAGVNDNQTDTLNQIGISSLTNLTNFALLIPNGSFIAQKVASGTQHNSALVLIGADALYNVTINKDTGNILGGANIVLTTDCLQRHPLVQSAAGINIPGGIRNNINTNPNAIDFFTKAPVSSFVYYTNDIYAGTLTSTQELDNFYTTTNNPYELTNATTGQELFDFLAINTEDDYINPDYTSKEGTVGIVDGVTVLTYVDSDVIVRTPTSSIPLDVGQTIDFAAIAQQNGTVKVWVENINGNRTLIRVDPF